MGPLCIYAARMHLSVIHVWILSEAVNAVKYYYYWHALSCALVSPLIATLTAVLRALKAPVQCDRSEGRVAFPAACTMCDPLGLLLLSLTDLPIMHIILTRVPFRWHLLWVLV